MPHRIAVATMATIYVLNNSKCWACIQSKTGNESMGLKRIVLYVILVAMEILLLRSIVSIIAGI